MPPKPRPRASHRTRTAYHEAGHAVAWGSATFSPPDIHAVSIEPLGETHGRLTTRARRRDARSAEPLAHKLRMGLALQSRSILRVTQALAGAMAHVRAFAGGAVAESLLTGDDADVIGGAAEDYLHADELARAVGCDPDATWARESRAIRAFLVLHWGCVERLASALLRQPRGRSRISGAALRALLASCQPARSRVVEAVYRPLARLLLGKHQARWRGAHWVVVRRDLRPPGERAVSWHETRPEALDSLRAFRGLTRSFAFAVRRRGPRRPRA